jgi:hypothetical protein
MWNALKKKVSKSSGSYHISSGQTGTNSGIFHHHGSPGGSGQDYHHLHVQLSDAEESDGSAGSVGGGNVASGTRAKVVLRRYKKIPSYSERLSDVAGEASQAATSASDVASPSPRRENPYAEMTVTKTLLLMSVNGGDVDESGTKISNSSPQRFSFMTPKSTSTTTETSTSGGSNSLNDNAKHQLHTATADHGHSTARPTTRVNDADHSDVIDVSNNNTVPDGADAEDLIGAVGGVDNGDVNGVDRFSERAIGCTSKKFDSDDRDDNANCAAAAFFSRRRCDDIESKSENASLIARISPPRMKRREKTSNRAANATSASSASTAAEAKPTLTAVGSVESAAKLAEALGDSFGKIQPNQLSCLMQTSPGKECPETSAVAFFLLTPPTTALLSTKSGDPFEITDGLSVTACRKSETISDDEEDESGSGSGAGDYCRLAPAARVVVERSTSEKSCDELSPAVAAAGAASRLSAVSQDDDESGYATLNDVAVVNGRDFADDVRGAENVRRRSESRTTGSDFDFCWQHSLRTSTATAGSLAETGSRDDDQNVFTDGIRDPESTSVVTQGSTDCDAADLSSTSAIDGLSKSESAVDTSDESCALKTKTVLTQTKTESEVFDNERKHGRRDMFPGRSRTDANRRLMASSSDESFSIGTMTTTLSGGFRRTDVDEADTTTAESMATTTTTTTSGDDSDSAPRRQLDILSSVGRHHRKYHQHFDEGESSEDYCDIPDDHISTSTRTVTPPSPPPPPPPRNNICCIGSRRAAPDLPPSTSVMSFVSGADANNEDDRRRAAAGTLQSAVVSPVGGQDVFASNAVATITGGVVSEESSAAANASADDDRLMISIDLNEDMLTVAEPTHMSWHEVMQSAQILGIPLHRMPTAAAAAAVPPPASMSASWSQPTTSFRSSDVVGRRLSLSSSSVTSSDRSFVASPLTSPSHPADLAQIAGGNGSQSSTPRHHRPGLAVAQVTAPVDDSPSPKRSASKNKKLKSGGSGAATGGGTSASGNGSGSSPFRTKLHNLFSRKSSDDSRSPSKSSTAATTRKEIDARSTTVSNGCNSNDDTGDRKFVIMRRHRDGRQPQNLHHHRHQQQQSCSGARAQSSNIARHPKSTSHRGRPVIESKAGRRCITLPAAVARC